MINRNEFLKLMGAATGAAIIPDFSWALTNTEEVIPKFFDLHCHPAYFVAKGRDRYQGDEKLSKTISEMNSHGLDGVFITLVADTPLIIRTDKGITYNRRFKKDEAWAEFKRQINILNELKQSIDVNFITKASELNSELNSENVKAFIACEGGGFIEGLGLLDEAYEDGLRSVQLVHYVPNHLGDLQTSKMQFDGLSSMGKDVVKKMNAIGMVIDVAHASEKTVKDVLNLTDAPLILSHSILKMESNRPIEARSITVEHAKMVAETGGVIGAWPSGFNLNFEEFVDNTLRLVDAVGIDHVGIGTDMDANYKPVIDSYSQLPRWFNALQKKGLTKEEAHKIAGGNARRVIKQVLKS